MHSTRFEYDRYLISALIDRWRPETNTFHFIVGEFTIMLEDVSYLFGLPLIGELVGFDTLSSWLTHLNQRFARIVRNKNVLGYQDFFYVVKSDYGVKKSWINLFDVSFTQKIVCILIFSQIA